ncbi:MAG: M14 family zinc carboxypeptidase [Planctomycetota bacterium]
MPTSLYAPHRIVLAAAFAGITALPAPSQAPDAPPIRSLLEVRCSGPAQMQQLLAMDLDLAGCRLPLLAQKRIEVIGRPGDETLLRAAGMSVTVRVADMAAAHAQAVAPFAGTADTLTPAIGQGSMGGHYTLAEMESILDDFHQNYPSLCSAKISIGQSIEGRDLWMVKISDNVGSDENEPEVLYDALHHAREPLSMSTTLLFMDELLDGYGSDPEATFLINERELYFIPCVNPDGYEFNRQNSPNGGGLWRKNRRDNGNGTFGIDLNRNYATQWNAPNGGSSSNPGSDLYRGTAPFSEPETTAVEAFSAQRSFVQVFSSHSYTDVLLRPWAYQIGDPSNVAAYNVLGAFMVQENGIAHGRWGSLLYISSGTSIDHHHAVRGSYAWTAELGRANEGGFWPVGATIETIARRHQRMFRKAALTAGAAFGIDSIAVTEASGGNGNQVVEPGETAEVVVSVANVGAAPAALTIELLAVDPALLLGSGSASLGALPAFATTSNATAPLTVTIPAGYANPFAALVVRITGDGRSQDQTVTVPLLPIRSCVTDDFEQNRGFARAAGGTATTGLWERATPAQTTSGATVIQPGTQTTPGGSTCWITDGRAGAAAGTYDVDGGFTEWRSPTMDLSHLAIARVAFDLWYGESQANDPLTIEASRDGGATWALLDQRTQPTGAWLRVDFELPAPTSDATIVRVRAQDLAPSLVEAGIDQFEVRGAAADGATTLLGSGELGTSVRVGMNAAPGSLVLPVGALGLGPGLTAPGIVGTLLLDPATVALLPLVVFGPAQEGVEFDLMIPAQPSLIGTDLAFQSVMAAAGTIAFGGNAPVITLQ